MNKIQFSIIIPAYNAELFIKDAIDSVLNQSYTNYEVIVVDDNSIDATSAIVNRVNNSKIQLYTNTRGKGASDARNFGLSKAVGDYVLFLDSDDFFCHDKLLEVLSNRLEYNQRETDVLYFGYVESKSRKPINIVSPQYYDVEISKESIIERTLYPSSSELNDFRLRAATPWGKAYKLNFLKENLIQFPSGVVNSEDAIFNLRILSKNPIVNVIDIKGYHYWINSSNSGHRFLPEFYRNFDYMVSLFNEESKLFEGPEYKQRINLRLFSFVVKVLSQYYLHPRYNHKNIISLEESGGGYIQKAIVKSIVINCNSSLLPINQRIVVLGIKINNYFIVKLGIKYLPNFVRRIRTIMRKYATK